MKQPPGPRYLLAGLVLLMALAAVAVGWATRNGPGFEGNSVPYVSAARTYSQSGVMLVPGSNGGLEPLLLWPPLYPAAMSLFSHLSGDVLSGGRWLNICLFPLNILLLALLAWRLGLSRLAGTFVCVLFAFAPVTLYAHVFLMSESITLFWWLATLNLLLRYSSHQSWSILLAAAFAAAMTWMSRFAGIAAIVSGALFITALTTGPWGRRLARAIVFGLVAIAPLQIWIHLFSHVSTLGTRKFGLYGLAMHQMESTVRAFLRWIIPFDEMAAFKFVMLAVFVCWLVFALMAAWRYRKTWFAAAARGTGLDQVGVALVLLNLAAIEGLIFFTGIFLDPTLDMGDRMHYFGFVFTLILVGALGTVLCRSAFAHWGRWARALALGVPLVILAAYLINGALWVWHADEQHLEFNDRDWRSSPTLAAIETQYAHTLIYTNQVAPIYLRTGRTDIRSVPYGYEKTRPISLDDFQQNLTAMLRDTAAHHGIIVYFSEEYARAPVDEVAKDPRIKVVQSLPDGIIFAPVGPSS